MRARAVSLQRVAANNGLDTLSTNKAASDQTDTTEYAAIVADLQPPNSVDPAMYAHKKLLSTDITLCLNAGPYHPPDNFVFPKTGGRSFQATWFYRFLPQDSMKQRRHWLSYSLSTDKVFCLPCLLFGGPLASCTWARDGWNDWRNGIRVIDQHESTKEHQASEIARFHWITGKSLRRLCFKPNNAVIGENRQVVSCVIDCVKYLSQEMMALRGHDSDSGKLLNLFRLLAKYHAPAAAYLQRNDQCREEGRKLLTNFMSPRNIMSLVMIIRQLIQRQIVAELQTHKKCSIIADGTYDSSKREATVLLLRYIENREGRMPRPVERLLDVFSTGDSSGAVLCARILESLAQAGIDVQWIYGQGYDGAGNVRGNCQGLKSRIQALNSKAVYIWCYGHRFNLVIEATVSSCSEVKNALGLLEELYTFFSGHKRNAVFTDLQGSEVSEHRICQLKRVTSTRWNSKQAAVDTTIHCFDVILSALQLLSSASAETDSVTKTGANGLLARLRDFRFIIVLFTLKEIFGVAGPVTRQLQGISVDLAMASHLVSSCRTKFIEMRKDENVSNVWQAVVQQAQAFATEHEIDVMIKERRKTKRKMDGEEATDHACTGEERLRISMFIPTLDAVCAQMSDRFSSEQTQLMKEMNLFSTANIKPGIRITAVDIVTLSATYNLDSAAIAAEFQDFCNVFSTLDITKSEGHEIAVDHDDCVSNSDDKSQSHSDEVDENEVPQELDDEIDIETPPRNYLMHSYVKPLEVLYQLSGYPHLLRLYWILVTLPVTSCSAERALSRLRIVKNRLRSSMCDDWMRSLMVMASEKDILNSISNDTIIDSFACLSDRLKQQLVLV